MTLTCCADKGQLIWAVSVARYVGTPNECEHHEYIPRLAQFSDGRSTAPRAHSAGLSVTVIAPRQLRAPDAGWCLRLARENSHAFWSAIESKGNVGEAGGPLKVRG